MKFEANKAVVQRFNLEVIQEGNEAVFRELMAEGFINRSAPAGTLSGPEGMWQTFQNVLRPALSNLRVTIHDQVAEEDSVTTRKVISGIHEGMLHGIAPTHRKVEIEVIDMVRVKNGKYIEHWGVNTLPAVLADLRQA